jgi:type II secretory pathway pseudopilin PulG
MPVSRRQDEQGFTMIMTVIGLALIAMLVLVTVSAVSGDAHLTGRDIARKQAYEAAKAGLDEYAFHLHSNTGYWAECTKVPTPDAVNQEGSTANRRPVPGNTGATYAIELIPATGHTQCDPTNIATATASMLESLEPMKGTFRVRSNGFSGNTHVAITATFKPASFLDYVYFTQLETSDPVTYGESKLIEAAEKQCSKTIRGGRYEAEISSGKGYCDAISFVHGDNIKGPMHTNDAFVICENPVLGRNASDPVEVSAASPGWYSTRESFLHSGSSCKGEPNFKGTFRVNAPVLIPPETNSELSTIAEPTFRFHGEVKVCLNGSTITVGKGMSCTNSVLYSGAFPSNGVIYVENELCTGAYSPFNLAYPSTPTTCGNVSVEGKYSKPLTIAAGNDIIITGNLERTNEEGMLGLIANNFIRVYHPVTLVHPEKCTKEFNSQGHQIGEHCEENLAVTECTGNASGALTNPKIEAAILAIKHSFIVDNYKCGAQLGSLNVKGAIAQKYRGAVGTTGNTGYLKNYEYDERLKTTEPPSFIEPIKSDWVIGRETTE